MSHKLLIYHDDAKLYQEVLARRLPRLEIRSATCPEEACDFIKEAEIILSWQIPDDLLKRAGRLRWFASTAAGNEDLVKNPNLSESVLLTKATVYGEMMAEYVFAYLLYFGRNLSKQFEDQKKKIWNRERPERLRGKVMGILGLGSVGKEIARRGKQFGMKVFGVKRDLGPMRYVDQVFGPRDLVKMIPIVDCLVVALPSTPETYHLIGERELSLMKEGAILFSIGRGKTIDERALTSVLKSGKIKAVLDVFETEPLPPESELWNLNNVIITPHVSGINIPEEICKEFIKNYRSWVRGKPLIGLVDRNKGY
jgi:phosphoglycerate dehydrogenase-like enzyme